MPTDADLRDRAVGLLKKRLSAARSFMGKSHLGAFALAAKAALAEGGGQ